MYILGIESSAGPASAAVIKDGNILSEFYLNTGLTHSQTLMPLIAKALEMTGVNVSQLNLISVSCGPGSFTGVRIGVASAKGIAMPDDIPCYGASSLETIAYNFCGSTENVTICAVMDARCSQVYRAFFKIEDGEVKRLNEDKTVSLTELENEISELNGKIIFAGDGAEISINAIPENENYILAQATLRYQKASSVAFAGMNANNKDKIVTAGALRPIYLQLPQAQRELNKKRGSE